MLTKADKWLIISLIFAALAGVVMNKSLFNGGGQYAQISVDGKIVKTIPLREGYYEKIYIGNNKDNENYQTDNREIIPGRNNIEGYGAHGYNIIEINSTIIHVKAADCPDQICVKTGWISASPQQIVCLPNRVVVKIISGDESGDIDDIAK